MQTVFRYSTGKSHNGYSSASAIVVQKASVVSSSQAYQLCARISLFIKENSNFEELDTSPIPYITQDIIRLRIKKTKFLLP